MLCMNEQAKSKPDNERVINMYNLFEEKRAYPRIKVNCLAELTGTEEDTSVNVIVHDISPDGVQIRCNRKTAKEIHPSGKFIEERNAPVVDMKFQLEIQGLMREIQTTCKLFYICILSQDVVAFGLKFIDYKNNSAKQIDQFIATAMLPEEERVLKVLDKPKTSARILSEIDDDDIDLDDTLNMLRRKKAIISFGQEKKKKHIKLESAIELIFKRLDTIEKRLNKLEKGE